MKTPARTLAISAGIALIAALAAALGAGVAATRQAAPTTVAVVDIDRLSLELEEFKIPAEQFRGKQAGWSKELQALDASMKKADEELQLIPETDLDARIAKIIQRSTLESELKTKSQLFQQASDLEQVKLFKSMYDRIADGAQRIAKRDGIDVMLVDDRVFVIPVTSRTAQSDALESKKILFASESVDLTDELLTMLNNEFNAGK